MMEKISEAEWLDWKTSLAALMASNRVVSGGQRYTRPAPSTYEHQWLWDSCFHAMGCRWLDPEMARDELLSVVAHQFTEGPDAGMVPHMTYWAGGGQELWQFPDRSTITQPPLIGVAAWKVFERSRDRGLLEALYPHLTAFQEWFERRRDPDRDNLVCLIHPWEAGCDSSPRWDKPMGLPKRFPPAAGTAARKALAVRLPEFDHDPLRLAQAGCYLVEPVEFNSIRAAELEAMAAIAGELGKPVDAAHWRRRALGVQTAVENKLLLPSPHDLAGLAETPIPCENAAEFITLFGGCASPELAARLVARLQQPDFWTPYPIPTSPTSSPSFAPDEYWRGNTWTPVNYLVYLGLRRYGYTDLASQLAEKTIALARLSGYREFYHPITGQGLGAQSQSWLALIVDMIATERQES
jgi:alpha,alpha-trehalase